MSGISRACAHLLKYVSPGLTFSTAHCYNTRQCTPAIAAMPWVNAMGRPVATVREGNHWKA